MKQREFDVSRRPEAIRVFCGQLDDLLPVHLVDRHVHVPHDVEVVEHVQGLGNLLRRIGDGTVNGAFASDSRVTVGR
jgi:hypothetical protein